MSDDHATREAIDELNRQGRTGERDPFQPFDQDGPASREPWDFTPDADGSLSLETAIFQALGAASTCWTNMAGAGIFLSDRAKEIGDRLVAFVRSHPAAP